MIDRDSTQKPMLATAGRLPPDDSQWAYEMKWDGIRALAHVGEDVVLIGRTGRDLSASYPELQGMAGALGGHRVVLDGEIVAFGEAAWPSFEVLQQRMNVTAASQVRQLAAQIPVTYLAFDLLSADGESLLGQTYASRRARLDDLGLDGPNWQTPPAFIGVSGADAQAVSKANGLEGIMAKRLTSRYEPGRRSASWLKIKNLLRQEFVVGGWKPGEGNRASLIGSLLVGVQGSEGLTFAGHVGTGFTAQTLLSLTKLLAPLRRDTSPFGSGVPPEHARGVVWVEPEVVIEATFGLWTSAGRLRAASFMGVRTDKDPAEVVRED
ncbi:MAG TPA: non-homologous end-joining DNA ligase [Streptosporangiaceae bacterium]|nr:non-homologous end-joining DNA ligase [Streptosporangiaceae bacterium]